MVDKFVTISSFDNPLYANLAKSKLESEGISCMLPDENIIAVNMLYSNAIGSIKLQVKEEDAQKALSILNNDESLSSTIEHNDPNEKSIIRCPKCNSNYVEDTRFQRKYPWLSILFIGAPVIISSRKWKCKECNNGWEEKIPMPVFIVRIVFSFILISSFLFILISIIGIVINI